MRAAANLTATIKDISPLYCSDFLLLKMACNCCDIKALFLASTILSFISAVFFLVGTAGYGDDEGTVETIPWGVGEIGGFLRGDFSLGLQGFVLTIDGDDDFFDDDDFDKFNYYKDCSTSEFCDTCEDAGAFVVVLCAVALGLAIATGGFGILGAMYNDSMICKVGSFICALITAIVAIIAVSVFGPCIDDFEDAVKESFGEATSSSGVSGILAFIGFILMFVATVVSSITCCVPKDEYQAPVERTAATLEIVQ